MRLSLDAILKAAINILDVDGVEALTFRRLAGDLGAGVASLYWHVESRAALMDLSLDVVLGEVDTSRRPRGRRTWQAKIAVTAVDLYTVLLSHRWAATQMILSSARGPNALRLWEFVQSTLVDAGFTVASALDGVSLLINHILASAAQEASRTSAGATGPAERRRRMREMGDVLRGLDPGRYPTIVASADVFADHDQAQQFRDGLDTILVGLARRLPEG